MTFVVLIILDGWGHTDFDAPTTGNAIAHASIPTYRQLLESFPHARLSCSGTKVGLPDGQMGNSEVGHLNLGAGRVVFQDILRIDKLIENNELSLTLQLPEILSKLRQDGGALHLVGLVSDGGVHSHIRHLEAILQEISRSEQDCPIHLHCFTDGRDTSPTSGLGFLDHIDQLAHSLPDAGLATVSGRYFAMDRDNRWDRTKLAYDCIVEGIAESHADSFRFLQDKYASGETDEFIEPTIIGQRGLRGMQDRDCAIFFNFRADRMRQLLYALTRPDFDGFARGRPPSCELVTFTEYDPDLPVRVVLPPQRMDETLSEVVSGARLCQLKCAETEKYAHVTYFFNGGREDPFSGEDRILIQSPQVKTYDLQPEMNCDEVAQSVVDALGVERYAFVLVNFANPDMVGHTGVFEATVRAVEAVDRALSTIIERVRSLGGVALITADHGNAERMLDADGSPYTAHTSEPVDIILASFDETRAGISVQDGILADVAPTVLELLSLPKPACMTGKSLVRRV